LLRISIFKVSHFGHNCHIHTLVGVGSLEPLPDITSSLQLSEDINGDNIADIAEESEEDVAVTGAEKLAQSEEVKDDSTGTSADTSADTSAVTSADICSLLSIIYYT